MPSGTYRGNGIDGVQDSKEKHTVDAPGVIRVPGAGDLLAGRVIDKSGVTSNVDLVVSCVVHGVASSQHVFKLYQRLSLFRHHHHITGRENTDSILSGGRCKNGRMASTSHEPTLPWPPDSSVPS